MSGAVGCGGSDLRRQPAAAWQALRAGFFMARLKPCPDANLVAVVREVVFEVNCETRIGEQDERGSRILYRLSHPICC